MPSQAVGTIWGYCEQFEEVTDRYSQLAGVLWKDDIEIVTQSCCGKLLHVELERNI